MEEHGEAPAHFRPVPVMNPDVISRQCAPDASVEERPQRLSNSALHSSRRTPVTITGGGPQQVRPESRKIGW
jgi:hypothetical protein